MGNVIKGYKMIVCVLVASFFGACGAPAAQERQFDDTKALLSKLKPLAEVVTSDEPSLKDAVQLIGGTPCPGEDDPPACYDKDGYRAIYWSETSGSKPTIRRVQFIIPEVNSGIVFQDIISIFGNWRIVAISKTSSVSFDFTNAKTGNKGVVFASLYDPPQNSRSPVMGIIIDHDHPSTIKPK